MISELQVKKNVQGEKVETILILPQSHRESELLEFRLHGVLMQLHNICLYGETRKRTFFLFHKIVAIWSCDIRHSTTDSCYHKNLFTTFIAVLVGFLRCMSISSCLSTIFAKGNNFCEFLFAPLDKETPLFKRDLLLKERICSCKHFMVLIFLNRAIFFWFTFNSFIDYVRQNGIIRKNTCLWQLL